MKFLLPFLMIFSPFTICSAQPSQQTHFPLSQQQTVKAEKTFTGEVIVRRVFTTQEPMRAGGAFVTFFPGSRTFWHRHLGGQSFVVLDGEGYVQEEGKPKIKIRAGDAVVCPPGVKHWHGASEKQSMTHLAISERDAQGNGVVWLEPVSETEYHKDSQP